MEEYAGIHFIICGQVLTGRLEVLENYFAKRFNVVSIIGISSIFANTNAARITLYRKGEIIGDKKLFNVLVPRDSLFRGVLFFWAYLIYFFSVLQALVLYRGSEKKIFIGIGMFPAFLGSIVRACGMVQKVVYYSIDYFRPFKRADKVFVGLDKWCAQKADIVWSISPRILEARAQFSGLAAAAYTSVAVPLCFDESLLLDTPPQSAERWSVVFVGTSGYFHGLHLLVEAVPELLRLFPKLKIKIIGPGPWEEISQQIKAKKVAQYFDFVGFVKEERELFRIVSLSAVGMALYVPCEDNPTLYADPGKPKLYAFCGVPVVVSKAPLVAQEIDLLGAGKMIEFTVGELVGAIQDILRDDQKWQRYRLNSLAFAKRYTSGAIFSNALQQSFGTLVK